MASSALLLAALLAVPSSAGAAPVLAQVETHRLAAWSARLGAPRPGEPFGAFLARAARLQWHAPYAPAGESVELGRFDCVSFLEASLALARCGWKGRPTPRCFLAELEELRYREGVARGPASRLHYFEEWLADNERRGRLRDLAPLLGATRLRRRFSYMTDHRERYPSLEGAGVWERIAATERSLGARVHAVVRRGAVRRAAAALEDGDVVAIVTTEPGRLVHHAGLVVVDPRGARRLLHASSHHGKVVLTIRDVADYVLRRPERWGLIAARPLAPERSAPAP